VAVSNVELRVNATQAVTALRNVDGQAKKFNTTISGTSGKLKATTGSLKVLPTGLAATGAGAKVAAGGFGALTAAAAPLLGPLIGISAVIGGLTKVFGNLAAQDFASAKIKTLGVDADALNPKLKSLSNELSGQASSLDLLSASYDVASAGFGETAELTDVLKASQLGATGGFSELATVADATTSVLNAYGLESDKAAKLVDGFIQTQNDGKIVVDQYAQQIGRLAPIAAGAGVGIDELNAAISTVTATGVPVESTFAGLRQVIAAIQKPTKEASDAAEKLGIDFSATALSTKGLGGVLEELVAKGGASEETLAQFFGSVEARTAILPLLNDQLVSFNKNLENQAKAQGTAAQAAFTAQNTIQGQIQRLGAAFTNLTTEGSEIGIVIRDSLKVAAVTVEALKSAFEITLAPVRLLVGVVKQIGTVIGEALGIEATNVLFNLEQGWIAIKEAITKVTGEAEFIGRVIGGVIGVTIRNLAKLRQNIINGFIEATEPVVKFFQGLQQSVGNVATNIVKFFRTAFQKLIDVIPEPLKKLLGGLELPKLNFDIAIPKFENPFKGLKEKVGEIKDAVIEYSEVERGVTNTVKDQLDAKNNIVKTNGDIKKSVEAITPAEKEAREEAEKLRETFKGIGQSVRSDLVGSLREAINGSKSFGEAISGVLNNLKNKLIDIALDKAISGIGGALMGGGKKGGGGIFGGFLSGLFGKRARGGPVSAGGAFLVGERGPEILQMGSKGGNIIPNSQIGGGGVTNVVTVNVDASGSAVSGNTPDATNLGRIIGTAVQAQLIKEKRSGGLLA
jgi:TP901 family phage tail tape measure protein